MPPVQDLLEELPSAHRLALAYAPKQARDILLALFALDARLATIVRKKNEAVLAQIRIAWWRETLRKERDAWPKGDLALAALAGWSDVTAVSALTDGWEYLLDDILGPDAIASFAEGRAKAMVGAARELGIADAAQLEAVDKAARFWALGDLSANVSSEEDRDLVIKAGEALGAVPKLPRVMRSLAVIAALGARSVKEGGGPLLSGRGSVICALRAGLFGR